MLLRDFCGIHSGFTARGRLEEAGEKGCPAIQLRDVSPDQGVLEPPFFRYDLEVPSARHLVVGGDLVFRSRGQANTATVISESVTEPITVVVPLVILRPDRRRVLPEYLAWAINRPDSQRRFDAAAQGTSMRMIPMAVLEQLDIPLPDLRAQRRIVDMHALARRETLLLRELAARCEQRNALILGEAARLADQQKKSKQ